MASHICIIIIINNNFINIIIIIIIIVIKLHMSPTQGVLVYLKLMKLHYFFADQL